MSSERGPVDRERLGELLEHALALGPRERAAYLATACRGHEELREELTSLLDSQMAEPDFLEKLRRRVLPVVSGMLSKEIPAGERVAGRYEILERLGSGGMGVVYKARDLRLGRLVVLKFLPPYRSADPAAREALKREARAASALEHPNIAVVHDIGATDEAGDELGGGPLFIVMAHYPGETLEDRIGRGPLDVHEAIDHAVQLAEALAAAHEAGIVHRDIKPANVLVTDRDLIKVLDFGLAMVASAAPARERSAGGTVAYMSPEQTRGGPVDQQTDIWSLGVVLYEMLTGIRPFRGEAEAVVHGIRHVDPPRLASLNADLPPGLVRVVNRCMAKEVAQRYATAATVAADLRSVVSELAQESMPSLVVLPFANVGGDPDNEYFSQGLTEEVTTSLSHVLALRVITPASAMRFTSDGDDVRTFTRRLGVRFVLEGSIHGEGDTLRITARLLDARVDQQLWADMIEGAVHDAYAMQEHIARGVAEALCIRPSPSEARALASPAIPNAVAYEAYLRARHEAWRFSREGLARAERFIETALDIVGDNELLYGTLGHIAAMRLEAGIEAGPGTIERVRLLANKVFELNRSSGRGHFLTMFVAFHRGDLRAAIRAGERARALEPNNPDTLLLLGYVYAHAGRNTDAGTVLHHALRIDPLTPVTHGIQGFVAIMDGRFEDAIEPSRRGHAMDPDSPYTYGGHAWVLAYNRRLDEACAVCNALSSRFPETAYASLAQSFAHALRGESNQAVAAVTPVLEAAARGNELFARELAHCYALAGENQPALDWLERAVDLGMWNYEYLARHDWFLDGLRNDSRFEELLARVRRARSVLA